MSEQDWRDFVTDDSTKDWVVLHGGPTAVFRVTSMVEAARLATALATVDGVDGSKVLLTLASDRVTVRLMPDLWGIDENTAPLARAISSAAAEAGVPADRSAVQGVQLAISARPDDLDVGFWRAVLGFDEVADDNGADPLGLASTFWMQGLEPDKPLRHAMHLDVSVAREQVQERLAAALAAGGTIVDDSEAPAHWVLADRAGNKVCVCAWPDGSTLEHDEASA